MRIAAADWCPRAPFERKPAGMGIGVAAWLRDDGELSESQVAYEYGELALRILRPPAPREQN